MPGLHWSSPGSGGPSTVVLFVFLEGGSFQSIFFWQGEAVLYVFLSARLKTRDRWSHFNPNLQNKGKIPKQHASCNNFLGSPPLQTTIFNWFRDISWIQIPREKNQLWMRGQTWQNLLLLSICAHVCARLSACCGPSWRPSFEQASAWTLLKMERLVYKESHLECL